MRRANMAGSRVRSAPIVAPETTQITANRPASPAPKLAANPNAMIASTIATKSTRFSPHRIAAADHSGAESAAARKNSTKSGPSQPVASSRASTKNKNRVDDTAKGVALTKARISRWRVEESAMISRICAGAAVLRPVHSGQMNRVAASVAAAKP